MPAEPNLVEKRRLDPKNQKNMYATKQVFYKKQRDMPQCQTRYEQPICIKGGISLGMVLWPQF